MFQHTRLFRYLCPLILALSLLIYVAMNHRSGTPTPAFAQTRVQPTPRGTPPLTRVTPVPKPSIPRVVTVPTPSPLPTPAGPVFNVTQMGSLSVKPNDPSDSTDKLQAIIRQCPDGGTVYFPAGTYLITKSLDLTTACSMLGEKGRSIISTQPVDQRRFFVFVTRKNMQGLSFQRLVFEGGGIFLESGPHRQVTIRENIFRDFPPAKSPSGRETTFFERVNVFCSLGLSEAEISDNIFENSPDSYGVEVWGPISHFKFNRNYCYNIRQCIHTASRIDTHYPRAEFNHNVGLKLSRMGIEIQTLFDDAQIIGNYMADWRNIGQPENYACMARYGYDCDTMGLSLAFGGFRAIARDNIVLGPASQFGNPTEGGTSFGIELYTAEGSITTNNFIVNMAPAIVTDHATGNYVVAGNYMCGSPYATQIGWNARWQNNPTNVFSDTCANAAWISLLPPPPRRPF
ncbi:MAG TPA: glycosyl hydrolase family 28-related protein [Blastocatellia bacterium]|nr:glycosyl hydrolase family 28-related protein [Blastocatellia bacterium]